ncbi:MAG TPA: DegV family protein [Gaiellaceae bacterium]|nr:DegV family protein [Gaiellaceae bacterium]
MCTDSSSLLPPAAALLGVEIVPVHVALDGRRFDDSVESTDDFYRRLRGGAVATTSQPTPSDFADAYGRAADRGAESVVSIHLDRRTSGTIASAEIAASAAPLPVTVVDTGTVSFGVAVCVRAAAAVTAVGGTARDAAEEASRLGRLIENVFVARAGPGGRIPTATDWTVLRFADGAASVVSTCASLADAVGRMATHTVGTGERISAAVGYAGPEMEGPADQLAHDLLHAENVVAVERYRVDASVGAHTGADSLGVFWWPDP